MLKTWVMVNNSDVCSSNLSLDKNKELYQISKFFLFKVTEIIIQSRSGEKVNTKCTSSPSTKDQFNLNIPRYTRDLSNIIDDVYCSRPRDTSTFFCIEIYLKTIEDQYLLLETWNFDVIKQEIDLSISINSVHNKISILLKSLLTASRTTPAYFLSRRQGPDSYKVCYKISKIKPLPQDLGDNHKIFEVGKLTTPIGQFNLTLCYRTKILFDIIEKPEKKEIKKSLVKQPAFAAGCLNVRNHIKKDVSFECLLRIGVKSTSTPSSESQIKKSKASPKTTKIVEKIQQSNSFPTISLHKNLNRFDQLGSFYVMCKSAPGISTTKMEETLQEQIGNLSDLINVFEAKTQGYDDFVKSLYEKDESEQ